MLKKARSKTDKALPVAADAEQEALLQAMTNFGSSIAIENSPTRKKRKENPINPVTKADENAADDVLYAISNLGIPRELEAEWEGSSDRDSRFWYRPTISFSADVDRRKRAVVPKEAQVVLDAIDERAITYSTELPPELDSNMTVVREFWLKEIAPLTLPAQAGAEHARSVITKVLGSDVDSTSFIQFQRMLGEASKIKIAQYLVEYMGLQQEHVEALLQSVAAQKGPREVMYVPLESDRRQRPEPKPKQKEEALQ